MRAILMVLVQLALLLRGGARLRLIALFRPERVMDFVSRFQPSIARTLFSTAALLGGLRMDFEKPRMALPGAFLLVSNHQSLADIPALAIAFAGHGLRFVAKRELGRGLPYISPSLRMGRHALISRTGDFREGADALKALAGLAPRGICPVVFPEGTRSRDGAVKPFFAGATRVMLEKTPLPVLSVAVDGGWRVATVPRLLLHMRGTTYRVRPIALHPAPRGKREIVELLGTLEREIGDQVAAWRREGAARRA